MNIKRRKEIAFFVLLFLIFCRLPLESSPSISDGTSSIHNQNQHDFSANDEKTEDNEFPPISGGGGTPAEEQLCCDLKTLKGTITSSRFQEVRTSASLDEVVALAKAELLLKNPFLDSFPPLLTECEVCLTRQNPLQKYRGVIKQDYLKELLDLKKPEDMANDLLRSTSGRIVPSLIVDIGANIGQTAIPLAKENHTVFSFEPVASNCEKLKRNIKKENLERYSHIFCVGIDNKEETKSFGYVGEVVGSPDPAGFKIIDPTVPSAHVMSTVTTAPLEKFLNSSVLNRIHLFKTDTQGNEEAVLRGSLKLFGSSQHPRFVFIEFSHGLLTSMGSSPKKILEIMYKVGYVCTHLVFHHLTSLSPKLNFEEVDTPKFLVQGGVMATLDEMAASVGPSHNTWTWKGNPLSEEVQNKGGWTDLLCFG